jgi:hypothetical protein
MHHHTVILTRTTGATSSLPQAFMYSKPEYLTMADTFKTIYKVRPRQQPAMSKLTCFWFAWSPHW